MISFNLGSPKSLNYFTWLGIKTEYHALSHWGSPDSELAGFHTRIDTWNCEQLASLAGKLAGMSNGEGGSLLEPSVTRHVAPLSQFARLVAPSPSYEPPR